MKLKAMTQPLPLAKLAYERLRNSIIHGQLLPGEVYNEMALAKDLGISRTPVKEAPLELATQVLMNSLPTKGMMIRSFTGKDLEEIFELRRAIEFASTERVPKANPPCGFSIISQRVKDQKKAVTKSDFTDFMKHERGSGLSGNFLSTCGQPASCPDSRECTRSCSSHGNAWIGQKEAKRSLHHGT